MIKFNNDITTLSIDPVEAINQSLLTPIFHQLSVVHSHVSLLISLCQITQNEVRSSISIHFWVLKQAYVS